MLKGTKSASDQSRGGANECSDASRAELEAFAASASEQIAALQARVRELEDLSERDELTGLTNRRGLKTYLRRATSRSTRSGREGVVAFFDLDGFKQINDRFGHDAGTRRSGSWRRCCEGESARPTRSPASEATSSWSSSRT